MESYYTTQKSVQKGEKLREVSRQLKICVACGNTQVEEYEFGISCELCGTSFYFGRIIDEEVS
jgi:ribosomal protein L37AE/L43A